MSWEANTWATKQRMKLPQEQIVTQWENEVLRWNDQPAAERAQSREANQSIYVIHSSAGISKIGISINPKRRLVALQWANPTEKLTLEWTFAGKWSQIAMAEKVAHRMLDRKRLKGEWFKTSPRDAIEFVKKALQESGIDI